MFTSGQGAPLGRVSAYLLDGVLCEAPPPCWVAYKDMRLADRLHRRAELLTHYRNAEPLFAPHDSSFYVFATRSDDVAARHITALWLARRFARRRIRGLIYMQFARTLSLTARTRAAALHVSRATEYTDDSPQVLTALASLVPAVRLWLFDGELRSGVRPDPV